ncbi:MAG: GGDEF domain-containing protein [Acidobacteria bacterium]|nr:GGDEF domain-containing protein [Acidobacteriota bacterium]
MPGRCRIFRRNQTRQSGEAILAQFAVPALAHFPGSRGHPRRPEKIVAMMRSAQSSPDPAFVARTAFALGAIALETARRLERAETLSLTDDLTGLPNGRLFRRAVGSALSLGAGGSGPVSLLLIDLDDFKSVNDRYGHPRGDRVLVETAALLRTGTRRSDLVARVGGDEFAVLLPATGRAGAAAVAARLHRQIGSHRFLGRARFAARVTASIGAVTTRAGLPAGAVVQMADDALYRAKHRRRSRGTLRMKER